MSFQPTFQFVANSPGFLSLSFWCDERDLPFVEYGEK